MAHLTANSSDSPKMEELLGKLATIREGLKRNLADLQKNIDAINEPNLQRNIDDLKKDVETRASDLEDEVKQLRHELKVLRELLGLNLGNQKPAVS